MDSDGLMTVDNNKAFFKSSHPRENFNFHDYFPKDYDKHLIVEGNWDHRFLPLVTPDIEGLSLDGVDENIDVTFVADHFPHLKRLLIRCKSVLNVKKVFSLKQLEYFSFGCVKNENIRFELQESVQIFNVDWKSKYLIDKLPTSLEYLSINKGNGLNWASLLSGLRNLQKIDSVDCDVNCGDVLLSLPKLRYLALTNCKSIRFSGATPINSSLKFIDLRQTPVRNLDWVKNLKEPDILVLQGCGDIEDIFPLKNKETLRGLSISGNTKIINGDLSALETLDNLRNCFIRPYKHYSHKSIYPWNWNNFDKEARKMVERK